MKINNRGFMLVEVIIVSVVVATIMTSLYIAFNRVYNAYEKKGTYTNIDALYGIKTISDYLIDEMKFNGLLNNFGSDYYQEITCRSIFDDDDDAEKYCNNIFDQYNISKIFLVKLNIANKMPDLPNNININQTFKDYITYLNNAITFDNDTDYVFIVETYTINTDDDSKNNILNKYAYLEVK